MADRRYARGTQAWMNRLALPAAVLLSLFGAWRVIEHRYLLAGVQASLAILALSWVGPIRRRQLGRALGAVGLGAMSLLVLVALALDLQQAHLPVVDVAARIGLAILFAAGALGQSRRRLSDDLPTREEMLRDPGLPRRMAALAVVCLALGVELVLAGADVGDRVASAILYVTAAFALLFSAVFVLAFVRSRRKLAA